MQRFVMISVHSLKNSSYLIWNQPFTVDSKWFVLWLWQDEEVQFLDHPETDGGGTEVRMSISNQAVTPSSADRIEMQMR